MDAATLAYNLAEITLAQDDPSNVDVLPEQLSSISLAAPSKKVIGSWSKGFAGGYASVCNPQFLFEVPSFTTGTISLLRTDIAQGQSAGDTGIIFFIFKTASASGGEAGSSASHSASSIIPPLQDFDQSNVVVTSPYYADKETNEKIALEKGRYIVLCCLSHEGSEAPFQLSLASSNSDPELGFRVLPPSESVSIDSEWPKSSAASVRDVTNPQFELIIKQEGQYRLTLAASAENSPPRHSDIALQLNLLKAGRTGNRLFFFDHSASSQDVIASSKFLLSSDVSLSISLKPSRYIVLCGANLNELNAIPETAAARKFSLTVTCATTSSRAVEINPLPYTPKRGEQELLLTHADDPNIPTFADAFAQELAKLPSLDGILFEVNPVPSILKICQSWECQFVDPHFMPNAETYLSKHPHRGFKDELVFVRPQTFCRHPELYLDGIDPDDMKQGTLGNCWFLQSLSVLANASQAAVMDCFDPDISNKYGIYSLRFWINGKWRYLLIDDFYPLKKSTLQPFSVSSRSTDELWPVLLEKGYAKLHGSYTALDAGLQSELALLASNPEAVSRFLRETESLGSPELIQKKHPFTWGIALVPQLRSEADRFAHDRVPLESLPSLNSFLTAPPSKHGERSLQSPLRDISGTGYVVHRILEKEDPDKLWREISLFHTQGALFSCGCDSSRAAQKEERGLVPNHEYALLDVREYPHHQLRLLRLRNPWGSREWNGSFSDKDEASWLRYPDVHAELKINDKDDGSFFIDWTSFRRYWDTITVCPQFVGHLRRNFQVQIVGGSTKKPSWNSNPQFRISSNASEPLRVTVHVEGPDPRFSNASVAAAGGKHKTISIHLLRGGDRKFNYDAAELIPNVEETYLVGGGMASTFMLNPNESVTAVASCSTALDLAMLTVYSQEPQEAGAHVLVEQFGKVESYTKDCLGVWQGASAAGPTSCDNPQIRLSFGASSAPKCKVLATLTRRLPEDYQPDAGIILYVVKAPADKAYKAQVSLQGDAIVAESKYLLSNSVSVAFEVKPNDGPFCIIPCMQHSGEAGEGAFNVSITCDHDFDLLPVPEPKLISATWTGVSKDFGSPENPQFLLTVSQDMELSLTLDCPEAPSGVGIILFCINGPRNTGERASEFGEEEVFKKSRFVDGTTETLAATFLAAAGSPYILVPSLGAAGHEVSLTLTAKVCKGKASIAPL